MKPVIQRIAIGLLTVLLLSSCAESVGRDTAAEFGDAKLSWEAVDEYLTVFLQQQEDPNELEASVTRLAITQWAVTEAQRVVLEERGLVPSADDVLAAELALQQAIQNGQLGAVAPPDEVYDHVVNFAWQRTNTVAAAALEDEAVFTQVGELLNDELVLSSRVGEWNPQAGQILPVG